MTHSGRLSDISLMDSNITINIPFFQTNQVGSSCRIPPNATHPSIRPVRAVHNLLPFRRALGRPHAPVFFHPDGTCLFRRHFPNCLRCILRDLPEPNRYTCHSFELELLQSQPCKEIPQKRSKKRVDGNLTLTLSTYVFRVLYTDTTTRLIHLNEVCRSFVFGISLAQ